MQLKRALPSFNALLAVVAEKMDNWCARLLHGQGRSRRFQNLAICSYLCSHVVRMLFSWDDFDRFRKVPEDVDPSFSRYIGMPLSAVPDPFGHAASYAEHFEQEFEGSMVDLGIHLEYRQQTREYTSGRYADLIAQALMIEPDFSRFLV